MHEKKLPTGGPVYMIDTGTIHTCDFSHPAQNFNRAGKRKRKETEAIFADQFAHAYRERFPDVHSGITKRETLFVREVPVHGNGIADLVVLNWDQRRLCGRENGDPTTADPTVRAFEVKLSDWRGGLMQAHRYRYFSNVAVLVIPKSKLKIARTHIDLFKTLRVGLWGFDEYAESITCLYTPRPKDQHVAKHNRRALATILAAATS